MAMFIVPYEAMSRYLPAMIGVLLENYFAVGFVVTLVAMLAVTLWLMGKTRMEG